MRMCNGQIPSVAGLAACKTRKGPWGHGFSDISYRMRITCSFLFKSLFLFLCINYSGDVALGTNTSSTANRHMDSEFNVFVIVEPLQRHGHLQ